MSFLTPEYLDELSVGSVVIFEERVDGADSIQHAVIRTGAGYDRDFVDSLGAVEYDSAELVDKPGAFIAYKAHDYFRPIGFTRPGDLLDTDSRSE
jgi:hypothetical protein